MIIVTKLTDFIENLFGKPVIVHIVTFAGTNFHDSLFASLLAAEWGEKVMASHQQQHTECQQEHIQEEGLSIHTLIQLNNAYSLIENGFQKGVPILKGETNVFFPFQLNAM